jgi:hypothetical protein
VLVAALQSNADLQGKVAAVPIYMANNAVAVLGPILLLSVTAWALARLIRTSRMGEAGTGRYAVILAHTLIIWIGALTAMAFALVSGPPI